MSLQDVTAPLDRTGAPPVGPQQRASASGSSPASR